MTFCGNCGTQVQDGIKFCPSCGKEVAATPAQPQQQVQQQQYQQPVQQQYQQPVQQQYQQPVQQQYQQPGQAPGSDAEANKVMAILSYILFFSPLLTGAHKTSPFV
ncbi:MAG: zinc ribbon domain-containing protein, partial [Oscillospiraceae bacterium]|nr:zinc ribbon domain-containing protein [Oscillospiraceae bacterium]